MNGDGGSDILIGTPGGKNGYGETYLISGFGSEPLELYSLKTYSDETYSNEINSAEIQEDIFVEMVGLDRNEKRSMKLV